MRRYRVKPAFRWTARHNSRGFMQDESRFQRSECVFGGERWVSILRSTATEDGLPEGGFGRVASGPTTSTAACRDSCHLINLLLCV